MKELSLEHLDEILYLSKQLNPSLNKQVLKQRITEIFSYSNYYCFGWYVNHKLIAICGAWITTRLYSGKQLEIDNFVVDEAYRGKKLGKKYLEEVEEWAKAKNCLSSELNSYVISEKTHRFYFKEGYKILGFHFIKKL